MDGTGAYCEVCGCWIDWGDEDESGPCPLICEDCAGNQEDEDDKEL